MFPVDRLVKFKKKKNLTISLCFPTLNEAQTIGKILDIVRNSIYEPGLVDEVVVIDSNSMDRTVSIVRSAGFKVLQHQDILPGCGRFEGKGDALWKSLAVLKGDIIIWCDSDIMNFKPRFIYGILGPLLIDDRISYVKGFYRRPLKIDSSYLKSEGGRVTELLVRPLLNLFYPELSKVFQPLSGEYAGRREILESIPFSTGYGVEVGMLIEIYERFGLDVIAQVNLRRRVHRNHPISTLSKMSFGILQTLIRKLQYYNKLKLNSDINKIYNQIEYINKEYIITPLKLEEMERPPMLEIKEYLERKKEIA
ncbi:MAG: glucosyl-3-phosphoglycerate synthase [Actinomycetota bacterium]|nr:MAG: glucosyl-3-phosphoglycerate synthase [Actinomycetota bacterium]